MIGLNDAKKVSSIEQQPTSLPEILKFKD